MTPDFVLVHAIASAPAGSVETLLGLEPRAAVELKSPVPSVLPSRRIAAVTSEGGRTIVALDTGAMLVVTETVEQLATALRARRAGGRVKDDELE